MQLTRRLLLIAALLPGLAVHLGAQGSAAPLPLKYAGPATVAAITPGDLMTRLYQFADDSMLGRVLGTESHLRATAYIERELRRLGLQPGGDNGSYFQELPVFARGFDVASTLTVGTTVFHGGVDFLAASGGTTIGMPRQLVNAPAIFGGVVFDTTSILGADAVRGKVLVLHTGPAPTGSRQTFVNSAGYRAWSAMLSAAATVMTIDGDQIPPSALRGATAPAGLIWRSDSLTPVSFGITTRVAEAIFRQRYEEMPKGSTGTITATDIRFVDQPRPARNVVAILPGSDAKLKAEYVIIGAPSDHLAPFGTAEHDSLRVLNAMLRPLGALSAPTVPNEEQWRRINAMIDSVRRIRPARVDSIYNGADDGGSGAMAALEIAEAMVKGNQRPKRSVLFIWHTGEGMGFRGAEYFTDHLRMPAESIVTEINLGAIGRGGASDVTGVTNTGGAIRGGPDYVQAIGSKRRSSEFGDLIARFNTESGAPLDIDYTTDAANNPLGMFCRGDQFEYARLGIPVLFLTTGLNADFHQVTDEPQYIDYQHYAAVTRFASSVALQLANLSYRPLLDLPKPNRSAACRQ